MEDAAKVVTVGNERVKIFYDQSAESPRTSCDNMGKMICFHKRYTLGDDHDYNHDDYNSTEELNEAIKQGEDAVIMLPLFLYDHSGITMNTTGFSCRWDSGQVGVIVASAKAIRESYGVKRITKAILEKATKHLVAEVETYDQYLTGEVYRFETYKLSKCDQGHEHEEFEDSCGGFLGSDMKENGIAENLSKELAEALMAA